MRLLKEYNSNNLLLEITRIPIGKYNIIKTKFWYYIDINRKLLKKNTLDDRYHL